MLIHSQTDYLVSANQLYNIEYAKRTIHQYSPQKRTITVRLPSLGDKKYYLQFPYLMFVRFNDTKGHDELYLYGSSEKIDLNEKLVYFPMLNVGTKAKVCLGVEDGLEILYSMENSVSRFWNSKFNLDICSGLKRHIKINAKEYSFILKDFPDSVGDFFSCWEKTSYPTTLLKENYSDLNQLEKYSTIKCSLPPADDFYTINNDNLENKAKCFFALCGLLDKEQANFINKTNNKRIKNDQSTIYSFEVLWRLMSQDKNFQNEIIDDYNQLEKQQNIESI
jgi:hypothetical protein